MKRQLVVLVLLPYQCLVTVNILWLFQMVPWVGLQCVIVVFPDHTHKQSDQEHSGSVVECSTRDRGEVGSSLTSVIALWS